MLQTFNHLLCIRYEVIPYDICDGILLFFVANYPYDTFFKAYYSMTDTFIYLQKVQFFNSIFAMYISIFEIK